MNYFYITGTSRGIGKAIAEELLNSEGNFVFGISRSETIKHKNYKHFNIDFSELNKVKGFHFEEHSDANKIVLISNAGRIREIKRVGDMTEDIIIEDYNINLIAPSLLSNKFVNRFKDSSAEKTIINISSGAGKSPIEAWSVYCASKAGLDMFSKVITEEQKIKDLGFKVFSISPGVVDTKMQESIRNSDQNDFSRKKDFINYQQSGQLSDPNLVAKKILHILAIRNKLNEPILSVRDF